MFCSFRWFRASAAVDIVTVAMPQHALKVLLDHRKINIRVRRGAPSVNRPQRRFARADLCVVPGGGRWH
jgi:hypothetical protein